MVLKKIKKYISVFSAFCRFSFAETATYRTTFIIGFAIEFGYQVALILLFRVIYSNISEIAGWSYYEMLFLLGLNIITSEIGLGFLSIHNLRSLPRKIITGDFDLVLTKPIHSLFNTSLSHPYLISILSSASGIFLMIYSSLQLNITLSMLNFLASIVLLSCGFIILYAVLVIFASLSFVFVNARALPQIGEEIMLMKYNPHQVYRGIFKIIFYFIFPIIYINSIPASTFLKGVEWNYMLLALFLAGIFLLMTIKLWNHLIRYYSSASS